MAPSGCLAGERNKVSAAFLFTPPGSPLSGPGAPGSSKKRMSEGRPTRVRGVLVLFSARCWTKGKVKVSFVPSVYLSHMTSDVPAAELRTAIPGARLKVKRAEFVV